MSAVTVIILVYNDPEFVKRAIESVISQTYTNLKIKILDNGSTDETPLVIRAFNDPRIEIITNLVNQRSEFAAKIALKTDTPYLSFLFSDDAYEPERIEQMVNAIAVHPSAAAVFSNNEFFDEYGKKIARVRATLSSQDVSQLSAEEHLNQFVFNGNTLHPCAMLIRTGDYVALGGFAPYLHRIGDLTFFTKLLVQRPVVFIPGQLQRITMFLSGRNESHDNEINWTAVAFERMFFLDNLRTTEALAKIESIFPELAVEIEPKSPQPVRLFWLGKVLFSSKALDYRLFAIRCMFDAYISDPETVDQLTIRISNKTFPQYIYDQQRASTQPAFPALRSLKQRIRSLPGGETILNLLRPLISLIREL